MKDYQISTSIHRTMLGKSKTVILITSHLLSQDYRNVIDGVSSIKKVWKDRNYEMSYATYLRRFSQYEEYVKTNNDRIYCSIFYKPKEMTVNINTNCYSLSGLYSGKFPYGYWLD